MPDERTETWTPYELPRVPHPKWYPDPDSQPLEGPARFDPRAADRERPGAGAAWYEDSR